MLTAYLNGEGHMSTLTHFSELSFGLLTSSNSGIWVCKTASQSSAATLWGYLAAEETAPSSCSRTGIAVSEKTSATGAASGS
jgi:hypothetical protein